MNYKPRHQQEIHEKPWGKRSVMNETVKKKSTGQHSGSQPWTIKFDKWVFVEKKPSISWSPSMLHVDVGQGNV